MSQYTLSNRLFELRDTLADQINVGLYQMKLQERQKKLDAKIASGKKSVFDRLALLVPFKWRLHYSMRKTWNEFISVAVKKNFVWKVFRIIPKELRYSVIGAEKAEELKASFFNLWEEILQKQNERLKTLTDTQLKKTNTSPSQTDTTKNT